MKKLLLVTALNTGCVYFMPEAGDWELTGSEIVSIECVADGFADDPFEAGLAHTISEHSHPLRFQFDISTMNWPGGAYSTNCLVKARQFSCEHEQVEWQGLLHGTDTVPMENNECVKQLDDPTQEICWARSINMSGEFSKDESPILSTDFQYTLTCLAGAACQLSAGSEHCTANIKATYQRGVP